MTPCQNQATPSSIQHPLRTHDLALAPAHPRSRHPHCQRKRLKRALRPMMIIVAAQAVHMQRQRRGARKAAQAVRQHLGAQVADLLAAQPQLDDRVRAVRQVHHCP